MKVGRVRSHIQERESYTESSLRRSYVKDPGLDSRLNKETSC